MTELKAALFEPKTQSFAFGPVPDESKPTQLEPAIWSDEDDVPFFDFPLHFDFEKGERILSAAQFDAHDKCDDEHDSIGYGSLPEPNIEKRNSPGSPSTIPLSSTETSHDACETQVKAIGPAEEEFNTIQSSWLGSSMYEVLERMQIQWDVSPINQPVFLTLAPKLTWN